MITLKANILIMKEKNHKKKILVVSQHYWPENFRSTDICSFFEEKNCEVEVLCGIPNYPKGKFFENYSYFRNRRQMHDGVKVRRVFEIPRGNNSNFRIFLNYISFPIASLFHIPYLLTQRYDKIFIFETSPVIMALSGIILGKLKRIETTMYVLDLWPENLFSVLPIKNSLLQKFATIVSHWHYRKVDKLVVLSEKMKHHLQPITKLSNKKIVIIPQVCEKLYEKKVKDKKLKNRFRAGFNILFTGSITPAQSFETILEAACIIRKSGIKDVNWIIVGDGMSKKWLEDEVARLGLNNVFFFEGIKPIEDIPKYTTNVADLLIACLVKSNLLEATIPAKVMSYFASGKPMVLAMDGEARDLVNNVGCGFAGPTENPKILAKNILKVYFLNPSERDKMGELARTYHFNHFERNMNLSKLHDFIFS